MRQQQMLKRSYVQKCKVLTRLHLKTPRQTRVLNHQLWVTKRILFMRQRFFPKAIRWHSTSHDRIGRFPITSAL